MGFKRIRSKKSTMSKMIGDNKKRITKKSNVKIGNKSNGYKGRKSR